MQKKILLNRHTFSFSGTKVYFDFRFCMSNSIWRFLLSCIEALETSLLLSKYAYCFLYITGY